MTGDQGDCLSRENRPCAVFESFVAFKYQVKKVMIMRCNGFEKTMFRMKLLPRNIVFFIIFDC